MLKGSRGQACPSISPPVGKVTCPEDRSTMSSRPRRGLCRVCQGGSERRIKGLQQRGPGETGIMQLSCGWTVGFRSSFLQWFGRRAAGRGRENCSSFH